ncbi:hypothetical protein QYF36_020482 [Acer negundo]|nr:hypothetical protein QYF36_020482 [Acer negundo]
MKLVVPTPGSLVCHRCLHKINLLCYASAVVSKRADVALAIPTTHPDINKPETHSSPSSPLVVVKPLFAVKSSLRRLPSRNETKRGRVASLVILIVLSAASGYSHSILPHHRTVCRLPFVCFRLQEDVSLEDMMIEDNGEVLELVYPCRCADYFSVDSLELGQMGFYNMSVFYDEKPPHSLPQESKYLNAALKDAFSSCQCFNGRPSISGPEEEYQASDFDDEQEVLTVHNFIFDFKFCFYA